MKDNTNDVKALLHRALSATPQDFALTDVRSHIRSALSKIESVEQRREKREVAKEKRQEVRVATHDVRHILEVIDEMIAEEHSKIAKIKQQRNAPREAESDDGFDSTILG